MYLRGQRFPLAAQDLQGIYRHSLSATSLVYSKPVTPIFKKGDRKNVANYRPVSLTSTPCKTLEHIIYQRLIAHFEQNNIISDIQHGFRKRRGCDIQLLILVDELASALDQRKQIDLVIMDFYKVFVNVLAFPVVASLPPTTGNASAIRRLLISSCS